MLETLMTIVSQPEGSLEMLRLEDLSPLTNLASQTPSVLDIIGFMWTNASASTSDTKAVQESIDKYMPKLLDTFKNTDAVTLINFVGNLIPKFTPEVSGHIFRAPTMKLIEAGPPRTPSLANYSHNKFASTHWQ